MNQEKTGEENRQPGPVEDLQELKEGDRVLFNDRATPLEVEDVSEDVMKIRGPKGGEYELYTEKDAKDPLIAKPGNRRYSSYAKNLRKVGEWQKNSDKTWKHTDTGAEISLDKNSAGFWNLKIESFEEEVGLPKYGFSDLESAREEAEKIVEKNPEG